MDVRNGTTPTLALASHNLTLNMTGAGSNLFSLVGATVTPGTGNINVTAGTFDPDDHQHGWRLGQRGRRSERGQPDYYNSRPTHGRTTWR